MVKAILFDLDDTLYEERLFFRGGFAVVGQELERRAFGSADETLRLLEHYHHQESREAVFQKLAARLAFPTEWIPELVRCFRSHEPKLSLAPDALEILPRFKERFRLGCVTDGWAEVQRRKACAVGLERYVDVLVIADELGREFWKPHERPFLRCCELLSVLPQEAIFVGDNPTRDMAGARNAGLKCVRLRRPGAYFAPMEFSESHLCADFEIDDLRKLEPLLRNGV